MNNQQIAATVLERITLMHGGAIDEGLAWKNVTDQSDPEGWKIKRAFEHIVTATQRCVELGELTREDLYSDQQYPSGELDALIHTIAARIDLDED